MITVEGTVFSSQTILDHPIWSHQILIDSLVQVIVTKKPKCQKCQLRPRRGPPLHKIKNFVTQLTPTLAAISAFLVIF